MLAGKRILLGVTGGIAAYKAAFLLREFQKYGAEVRVTMTPSATRFVGTETFAALSRHEVAVDVFNEDGVSESWTKHIYWGEWADIFVIAPCTANTLAKIVHGQSDSMLTSTVLAARCPILICPTMDGEMYESPAVSGNLEQARKMGFYILEPATGYLASGLDAKGRLPEPEKILQTASEIIKKHKIQGPLTGKRVVVSAGSTREFIDPIRFLSNPSSGKMGIAMAEAAHLLGGDVILLKGPVTTPVPDRILVENYISASDLFELVKKHADADIIIMAAAVADFRPVTKHQHKVKKDNGMPSIELTRNPDILEWLGSRKRDGQLLIGFAMETENLVDNARAKLTKKNADWICANSVSEAASGFDSDTNTIHLITNYSETVFSGIKQDVAKEILAHIFDLNQKE
ncbi:MAG: bifunctional phosphopantothenoylcysteine decarboxylase/phosphopantothenate--cysteine ligase CoaBC [Balneolaceae bacterium]|nr:MAG: bifunctional phosphopantothenoylcysteine decarboxylase/phosphopantothenate--cysteine ligase CoaBC [Balneolaceae bacterium]